MKLLNYILCKIFFHKLEVVKTYYGGISQKVYCLRCKRYFGINHSIRCFIPWDSELEQTMSFIGATPTNQKLNMKNWKEQLTDILQCSTPSSDIDDVEKLISQVEEEAEKRGYEKGENDAYAKIAMGEI